MASTFVDSPMAVASEGGDGHYRVTPATPAYGGHALARAHTLPSDDRYGRGQERAVAQGNRSSPQSYDHGYGHALAPYPPYSLRHHRSESSLASDAPSHGSGGSYATSGWSTMTSTASTVSDTASDLDGPGVLGGDVRGDPALDPPPSYVSALPLPNKDQRVQSLSIDPRLFQPKDRERESHAGAPAEEDEEDEDDDMPTARPLALPAQGRGKGVKAVAGKASAGKVGAKSPKKISHARKNPEHIPRPRNAFILFRKHVVDSKLIPPSVEMRHQNVSIITAKMWTEASAEQKAHFNDLARIEKEEHMKKYPGYRYQPVYRRTNVIRRRVRKDEAEEEKCRSVAELLLKGKSGQALESEIREKISKRPTGPSVAAAQPKKEKAGARKGSSAVALSKGALRALRAQARSSETPEWSDFSRSQSLAASIDGSYDDAEEVGSAPMAGNPPHRSLAYELRSGALRGSLPQQLQQTHQGFSDGHVGLARGGSFVPDFGRRGSEWSEDAAEYAPPNQALSYGGHSFQDGGVWAGPHMFGEYAFPAPDHPAQTYSYPQPMHTLPEYYAYDPAGQAPDPTQDPRFAHPAMMPPMAHTEAPDHSSVRGEAGAARVSTNNDDNTQAQFVGAGLMVARNGHGHGHSEFRLAESTGGSRLAQSYNISPDLVFPVYPIDAPSPTAASFGAVNGLSGRWDRSAPVVASASGLSSTAPAPGPHLPPSTEVAFEGLELEGLQFLDDFGAALAQAGGDGQWD